MVHLCNNSSISWEPASVAGSVLMSLCFIVGVPGNIAVIFFIFKHFKKNNFTVHLMFNLAAADILCLTTLPVWIYYQFYSWNSGQFFCELVTAVVYCSTYSGLITVTMLSLFRCIKIRYSRLWSRMSRRVERALLIGCWTLALIFSLPNVLTKEITEECECKRNLNSTNRVTVAILESLLGFVVPFTIMLVSYYCIHKAVNQGTFKHRRRSTKLVTRIVIVFFIFWAPYHIIKIAEVIAEHIGSQADFSNISHIAGCLTFINSTVNPLLYAFSSKSLRKLKQPAAPRGAEASQHSTPMNNTLSQLDT